MAASNDVWREIQTRLIVGTEIPNWAYDGGYTGKVTRIAQKYFDVIAVTGGRTVRPRDIKRTDFQKVYGLWDRYKEGLTSRDEIQQISKNSTYIFSILRWLEVPQGEQS
jgi:hypothetical protein